MISKELNIEPTSQNLLVLTGEAESFVNTNYPVNNDGILHYVRTHIIELRNNLVDITGANKIHWYRTVAFYYRQANELAMTGGKVEEGAFMDVKEFFRKTALYIGVGDYLIDIGRKADLKDETFIGGPDPDIIDKLNIFFTGEFNYYSKQKIKNKELYDSHFVKAERLIEYLFTISKIRNQLGLPEYSDSHTQY